jgi:hypothetical protein
MPQKRTERKEKRFKDLGDEAAWSHVADALRAQVSVGGGLA